jgi:hypothetical protein
MNSAGGDTRRYTAKDATGLAEARDFGVCLQKPEQNEQRTVIEPRKGDRRYVRRNKKGELKKEVSVGRSLAADRKRTAKTKVKKGQGDRGEVKK